MIYYRKHTHRDTHRQAEKKRPCCNKLPMVASKMMKQALMHTLSTPAVWSLCSVYITRSSFAQNKLPVSFCLAVLSADYFRRQACLRSSYGVMHTEGGSKNKTASPSWYRTWVSCVAKLMRIPLRFKNLHKNEQIARAIFLKGYWGFRQPQMIPPHHLSKWAHCYRIAQQHIKSPAEFFKPDQWL